MEHYFRNDWRRVNIYSKMVSAITATTETRFDPGCASLPLGFLREAWRDVDNRETEPWTEQSEMCAARLTAATRTIQIIPGYRDSVSASWQQLQPADVPLHARTSGPRNTTLHMTSRLTSAYGIRLNKLQYLPNTLKSIPFLY